jgi:signal transduction histidine kinase
MDTGLAEIMINNLLKNAVKYNIQDGFISIILTQSSLIIKNSGLPFSGNPGTLLERFAIGEKGNLGIGLSIVKQICELYNFNISYHIDNSIHELNIQFKVE